MTSKSPLISHYKDLFSRPENDSDMFYTKGHKIMEMQESNFNEERQNKKEEGYSEILKPRMRDSNDYDHSREVLQSPEMSPDQSK